MTRDKWIDSWTVVLCYSNHRMYQHNFLLSLHASRSLGLDRAERDAKKFAEDFKAIAGVLYCGPTDNLPEDLKQGLAHDHHC